MFYGKNSNIIQDLLEILFICGDPSLHPIIEQELPPSLMPRKESKTKKPEFHSDIESVYQLILKLANNAMDKHRILESILNFVAVKKEESFLISKALCSLIKTLLQCQQDTELFVERGKSFNHFYYLIFIYILFFYFIIH